MLGRHYAGQFDKPKARSMVHTRFRAFPEPNATTSHPQWYTPLNDHTGGQLWQP